MLQILINGQATTLPPDFDIVLERYNPMLAWDVIQGAKALDFTLPLCDRNNRIFEFYGHMQVAYKFKTYSCEKIVSGMVIERGYVQLKSVGPDGYLLFYTENLGEIFGGFQDTSMSLLDFGTEAIPGALDADADENTDKYCWPMIKNVGYYGNASSSYSGYLNYFKTGAYSAGPKVPMLFVRYVFELITELTGVSFEGDFLTNAVTKKLIVFNNKSLDGLTSIDFAKHLPQLTIANFIKELSKVFNLVVWPDVWRKVIRIDFAEDVFSREITVDWSRKFPVLSNKDNAISLDWEMDANDAKVKDVPSELAGYRGVLATDLQSYFPLNSAFSTLKMENGLPSCDQEGVSTVNGQLKNDFSPRLLFWRGLTDGLPLASSIDSSGVRLDWNHANGLKVNYWANYEKFRKGTFMVVSTANLNAYDISKLDMHRRNGELVGIHVQGQNYIVGNQRLNLGKSTNAVLELWRV
jgi:hypothetical protein